MVAHATKEKEEEEQPFEIADEGSAEAILLQAILKDGGRDVGQAAENDNTSEKDIPGLKVERVEGVT